MTLSNEMAGIIAFIVFVIVLEVARYFYVEHKKRKEIDAQKEKVQKDIEDIYDIIGYELEQGRKTGGNSMVEKTLTNEKTGLDISNHKALSELLEVHAKEEDYDVALDLVIRYITTLYEEYKFKLLKPQEGDYQSGYALTFTIDHNTEESKEILETLFKLAIDRGLSEQELSDKFLEKVKEEEVVKLGDVEVDGAGLSSVLSGEPVTAYIVYETVEYKQKREEQEEKQKEQQEIYEKAQEKQLKLREESHKALTEAAVILKEMNKEMVEANPEYLEAYEKVRELYQ